MSARDLAVGLVPRPARRLARAALDLARHPHRGHVARAHLAAARRRVAWRRWRADVRRRHPARPVVAIALVEHLGDIVAAEPIVRHLRRTEPDAYLVWIVGERFRDLVAHHPDLDGVLTVGCLTEWADLAGARVFDRVVDLHLHGRDCGRCRVPLLRADGGGGITFDNYYALGNLLHAFCRAGGLPVLADGPRLHVPDEVRRAVDALGLPPAFVAIHGTSNEASRDWTADAWQTFAARVVADTGLAVVEVGLRPVIRDDGAAHVDLCGRLSLLETAEVIRRARAFVGIDSGPAHLANAAGTPGIVLLGRYGPFDRYLPYSGTYADPAGASLLHGDGPAATIPVDRVLAALADRLPPACVPTP